MTPRHTLGLIMVAVGAVILIVIGGVKGLIVAAALGIAGLGLSWGLYFIGPWRAQRNLP